MEDEIFRILQRIVDTIGEDIIKSLERDKIKVNRNKNKSISFMAFNNILLKFTPLKTRAFVEIRKIDTIDLSLLEERFEEVKYKENELYVKIYIKDMADINKLEDELRDVYIYLYLNEPIEQFGCCSRYLECSDLLKCTNPDNKLARGCQYKENLEEGRIFYGRNKNIELELNVETSLREHKGNNLFELCDDYVVVDIETTGLSPKHDDIIEIGAIKVRNNVIVDKFETLINISYNLSDFIINLTGITDEMLQDGENIRDALMNFKIFVGDDILVGHNINFDINFLYDKCRLYLNEFLRNDFIDTMRMARKTLPGLMNYKLSTLADYFKIDDSKAHRGLEDVKITFEVYNKLKYEVENYCENRFLEIEKNLIRCDDFNNKKVALKTSFKNLDYELIERILEKQNTKVYYAFCSFCDYLIVNDAGYESYLKSDISNLYYGNWRYRAKELEKEGTLKVISESEFCRLFNIPYQRSVSMKKERVSAKDIVAEMENFDETHPLYNKICVFTGVLEKMERKQAMQMVVNLGGICGDSVTNKTNYLILGNNDYCKSIKGGKSSKQKRAEELKLKGNDIEIISENVFYDMIEEE